MHQLKKYWNALLSPLFFFINDYRYIKGKKRKLSSQYVIGKFYNLAKENLSKATDNRERMDYILVLTVHFLLQVVVRRSFWYRSRTTTIKARCIAQWFLISRIFGLELLIFSSEARILLVLVLCLQYITITCHKFSFLINWRIIDNWKY